MAKEMTTVHDEIDTRDRIYLEKLRLATTVILRLAEDPGGIPDTLEAELYLFRDRVDRALLLTPDTTADPLP